MRPNGKHRRNASLDAVKSPAIEPSIRPSPYLISSFYHCKQRHGRTNGRPSRDPFVSRCVSFNATDFEQLRELRHASVLIFRAVRTNTGTGAAICRRRTKRTSRPRRYLSRTGRDCSTRCRHAPAPVRTDDVSSFAERVARGEGRAGCAGVVRAEGGVAQCRTQFGVETRVCE